MEMGVEGILLVRGIYVDNNSREVKVGEVTLATSANGLPSAMVAPPDYLVDGYMAVRGETHHL